MLMVLNVIMYYFGEKYYFKGYYEYSLAYDTYILADSHGLVLENDSEIYGAYNFSAASDSYIDMLRKIKYLARNTNIQKVYITVDHHTLSPYRERINNTDRSTFYSTSEDYDSY